MSKPLILTEPERKTLLEMSIFHPHSRVRQRAHVMLRLAEGKSGRELTEEFGVSANSLCNWKRSWRCRGIVGLFEGHHSGRRPKLSQSQQKQLRLAVEKRGGGIPQLCQYLKERGTDLPVHRNTVANYLKRQGFSWKRSRYSLKKSETNQPI
jgi:transposase